MKYRASICLFFIFLFLFIFSIDVKAFTQFNYNPTFNSGLYGYDIADSFTNQSCFLFWCTSNTYSCFDASLIDGKMILDSSNNCNWNVNNYNQGVLRIKMLSNNHYYKMDNGNFTDFLTNSDWCDTPTTSPYTLPSGSNCGNHDSFYLPANQEGIIILNATVNDTTNLDDTTSLVQVFDISNNSEITDITSLNIVSLYIPPASYNRNLSVYASWKWIMNSTNVKPINITINRFQFFTYDTEIPYFSNVYIEEPVIRDYCHTNTSVTNCLYINRPYNYSSNSSSYYYNQVEYIHNAIGLTDCMVILDKDIVHVRRGLHEGLISTGDSQYCISRDYSFFMGVNGGVSSNNFLFHEVNNNDLIVTLFPKLNTGLGSPEDPCQSGLLLCGENVFIKSNSGLQISLYNLCRAMESNQTFDYVYPIESFNWLGNKYYFTCSEDSPSFNLFNQQPCAEGLYCNSGQQYFITSSCQLLNSSILSCGACGCGVNGCAYPSNVGSSCISNYTVKVTYPNCTISTKNTYPNYCNPYTNGTVKIKDSSGNEIICLDNEGNNITCADITRNQTSSSLKTLQSSNDWFGYLALIISSNAFGTNDILVADTFLSIIIAFGISIVVLYLGRKSKFGMEGFLTSMLVFISGFALLGKFNPIAWVLFIIVDGYMLYSMIHGGKH